MTLNQATSIMDTFADGQMPQDDLSLALVIAAQSMIHDYIKAIDTL